MSQSKVVPRNVRLAEAPSYGKPVIDYDPSCSGTQAYLALAGEMIGAISGAGEIDQTTDTLGNGATGSQGGEPHTETAKW